MFQHYGVILREFVVSTLPSYTSVSNAAFGNNNLKFKVILHMFYAVEISLFKHFKILKIVPFILIPCIVHLLLFCTMTNKFTI
jgi:hypothetical protein